MTDKTDVLFSRNEVAQILNVTPLTIANREKSKKYPEPKRTKSNYRVYDIADVFNLQKIDSGHVNTPPIIAMLHSKGVKDPHTLAALIKTALTPEPTETGVTSV